MEYSRICLYCILFCIADMRSCNEFSFGRWNNAKCLFQKDLCYFFLRHQYSLRCFFNLLPFLIKWMDKGNLKVQLFLLIVWNAIYSLTIHLFSISLDIIISRFFFIHHNLIFLQIFCHLLLVFNVLFFPILICDVFPNLIFILQNPKICFCIYFPSLYSFMKSWLCFYWDDPIKIEQFQVN